MRLFPILAAVVVMVLVYALVFERERVLALLPDEGDARRPPAALPKTEDTGSTDAPQPVNVVAVHSTAQVVDDAVVLRGRTEADRQVNVRAETSGKVISEPLRKGATVDAGAIPSAG